MHGQSVHHGGTTFAELGRGIPRECSIGREPGGRGLLLVLRRKLGILSSRPHGQQCSWVVVCNMKVLRALVLANPLRHARRVPCSICLRSPRSPPSKVVASCHCCANISRRHVSSSCGLLSQQVSPASGVGAAGGASGQYKLPTAHTPMMQQWVDFKRQPMMQGTVSMVRAAPSYADTDACLGVAQTRSCFFNVGSSTRCFTQTPSLLQESLALR